MDTPKDKIFEKHIAKTVKKLMDLCEKHDLPIHLVIELSDIDGDKKHLFTDSLYSDNTNNVFKIVSLLTRGYFSIIKLDNDDIYLRTIVKTLPFEPYIDEQGTDEKVFPYLVPYNGVVH